jgi:cyclic pyranopterin phosphate synthase
MVDVGGKPATRRVAVAEGRLRMSAEAFAALGSERLPKGDPLAVAEVAGILAAKRTADLIPLCHPLVLSSVRVRLEPDAGLPGVRAEASAETIGPTGVEMEALTAVTVALLTAYDMLKAVDRAMRIDGIRLLRKEGGRSGAWSAPTKEDAR